MANEISLNGLNVVSGGSTYKFTSIESIYSSLGINEERFLELLARDFYTVTLAASPTSSTVTYTDTDGSTNTFQTGQFARVADSSQEGGYKIWQCVNNDGTTASWVSGYDVMADYVAAAVPTSLSQLEGDEGHRTVSDEEKEAWNAKSDFSGSYNDLTDLPEVFEAPEEVVISEGVEPEEAEIWIDTSEEPAASLVVPDAPSDGKIYGRKDGQWATPTLTYSELEASAWVEDSTYEDFAYRCDLSCEGVADTDYAEVVFDVMQATSGVYAPVCRTSSGIVSIWASENTTITVPTIIITR